MMDRADSRRHGRAMSCVAVLLLSFACADDVPSSAGTETLGQREETSVPHVTLDDGELSGALDGRAQLFAGIPYAMPPVGERGWRRAEKNAPWIGVREASKLRKHCLDSPFAIDPRDQDEDCLYLNVWTPLEHSSEPMPVMVWLGTDPRHRFGTASRAVALHEGLMIENGRGLADLGVVVVTVESRRGLLGYFPHPDLVAEDGGGGNQGLYDQQRALHWVRENITRFGGDPERVTIFGQGAGAQDACFHAVAPSSRGLFQAVIAQSGSCTSYQRSRADGERAAQRAVAALSCEREAPLACLRTKPASAFVTLPNGVFIDVGPIVDGELIPEQPRKLFERGQIAKVPYIIGSTSDEAMFMPITPPEGVPPLVRSTFGSDALEPVMKYYQQPEGRVRPLAVRVMSEGDGICVSYEMAVFAAAAGASVWTYFFDVPRPEAQRTARYAVPGAGPGDELPYMFGTVAAAAPAVTRAMTTYWTNLAKYGAPNGPMQSAGEEVLLAWPSFAAARGARIAFAPAPRGIHVQAPFGTDSCELWRSFYEGAFAAGKLLGE